MRNPNKKFFTLLAILICTLTFLAIVTQKQTAPIKVNDVAPVHTTTPIVNELLTGKRRISEFLFAEHSLWADLDISSQYTARYFRTSIRNDMAAKGINFAGHYTIVGVGMTGWDTGYWIVDRQNGKAYVFPYRALCLKFQRDSNLIVINSNAIIRDSMPQPADSMDSCDKITDNDLSDGAYEPAAFLWENNKLALLWPEDSKPEINTFWTEYFTAKESGVRN